MTRERPARELAWSGDNIQRTIVEIIKNLETKSKTNDYYQAVQNVRGEGGAIKYSDFRDLVIHLRIERKWWHNGNLEQWQR